VSSILSEVNRLYYLQPYLLMLHANDKQHIVLVVRLQLSCKLADPDFSLCIDWEFASNRMVREFRTNSCVLIGKDVSWSVRTTPFPLLSSYCIPPSFFWHYKSRVRGLYSI
jgi:hypothetical protein